MVLLFFMFTMINWPTNPVNAVSHKSGELAPSAYLPFPTLLLCHFLLTFSSHFRHSCYTMRVAAADWKTWFERGCISQQAISNFCKDQFVIPCVHKAESLMWLLIYLGKRQAESSDFRSLLLQCFPTFNTVEHWLLLSKTPLVPTTQKYFEVKVGNKDSCSTFYSSKILVRVSNVTKIGWELFCETGSTLIYTGCFDCSQ